MTVHLLSCSWPWLSWPHLWNCKPLWTLFLLGCSGHGDLAVQWRVTKTKGMKGDRLLKRDQRWDQRKQMHKDHGRHLKTNWHSKVSEIQANQGWNQPCESQSEGQCRRHHDLCDVFHVSQGLLCRPIFLFGMVARLSIHRPHLKWSRQAVPNLTRDQDVVLTLSL